jgi:dTDP-4-amino-4,6-dideoxygalactose transaminase
MAAITRTTIPFNRPALMGRELAYMAEAIENGHISGDGPFSQRCQAWLEQRLGTPKVLLTPSATQALELAALLLALRPGDEVIVPSFTFVSTANAFALHGARPVFADIRPDTFNLDEQRLERRLSRRTRALVPVHYAGIACEMEAITALAARRRLAIVEDCAHALFGRYRGRALGTFGRFAALSFHETKNVTCGEGGALLLNDPGDVDRAEILREKGTDRSRFFRGQVDAYTWRDVGSSFLLSDLLAAFLLAQLEAADEIQAARRRIWDAYRDGLLAWAQTHDVRLPAAPSDCEQPYHLFYLLLPTAAARTRMLRHLREQGILGVFHYVPLHLSPMGRRFGGRPGDCPVAESVSERLVRLPFYAALTPDEQSGIMDAVRQAL